MRYNGLKGKAWESVKRSVRRREKDCYTCPAKDLQGKNAQAGHFFPVSHVGSNNTLSWEALLIHLQCGRCNGAGQGMQVEYRRHLISDYGEKRVKEFEARKYKVDPIKNWQAIIEKFDALG